MEQPKTKNWLWIRTLIKLAVVLGVFGLVIYWIRFSPIQVTAYPIKKGELVTQVMGTGTLETRKKVTISSKISGRILEIKVDQGERVKAGDLLVLLDEAEQVQKVEIAKASLVMAEAVVTRLKTDKVRAAAILTQARREYDRIQKLVVTKNVTEAEADKILESREIARAGMSRAEAAILEGEAQVMLAEKNLGYAQSLLSNTKILAPFDGLITRRKREPGDVVVPSSPILTLISLEELWISAWVDETKIGSLRPGQIAKIRFRADPEQAYSGTLFRIGQEADRETRELVVDVQLLKRPEVWAVGQRAEVFIETERKPQVIMLPAEYLIRKNGVLGVFVEKDLKVTWRTFVAGARNPRFIEIISGLEPGETVIKPRLAGTTLRVGRKVTTQ